MSAPGRDDRFAVFFVMTLSANPAAVGVWGLSARALTGCVGFGLAFDGRARSARPTIYDQCAGWVGRSARDQGVGSGGAFAS